MKKLICFFLAFCLLVGCMPLTAGAEDGGEWLTVPGIEGGRIKFDKKTGAIKDCEETVTTANIPSAIDGVAVTKIGEGAFNDCQNLTRIIIPSSVTEIQHHNAGFVGDAFVDCSSLSAIEVAPENRAYCSVGGVLFSKDKRTLCAYPAKKSGQAYEIPNGVTEISTCAFYGCANLTSVTIPGSVSGLIYQQAFRKCASLTSVTIPSSVTGIGYAVFSETAVTDVYYNGTRAQWDNMDIREFNEVLDTATIHCQEESSSDGWLTVPGIEGGRIKFDKKTGTITDCEETVTTANIPSAIDGVAVTKIGYDAFYGCTSLASVTIPDSVTEIGNSAFDGCTSLVSVTIPDTVTEIGWGAFANTYDANTYEIYYGGTRAQWKELLDTSYGDLYADGAFYPASIHFKDGTADAWLTVPGIEGGRIKFDNESGVIIYCGKTVTSANIPATVDGVAVTGFKWFNGSYGAFSDCTNLVNVTIPNGVEKIADDTFEGCTKLSSVKIPDSVTEIGDSAFSDCTSLADINIPNSVTCIGNSAFFGCGSLTNVTVPDSVTVIEWGAFRRCSSLANITIPANVEEIGNAAFEGCTSLSAIEVTQENPAYCSVDGVLFSKDGHTLCAYPAGKSGATYEVPNSVKTFAIYAFAGCTNLTDFVIPNTITEIAESAFEDCTNLVSVTIPESITDIHSYAFYYTALKNVYYDGTKAQWNAIRISLFKQGNAPLLNATIHYKKTPTGDSSAPSDPVEDEPLVETNVTESGNVATTTTQPNGDKELKLETPAGETIAEIKLPADPGKGKEFADVKPGAWYENAVDKATAYGLFGGTSETAFAPGAEMNRGMLTQVLYNLSGKTSYGVGEGKFSDVKDGAWYKDAVDWAAKVGVTSGTGDGGFSPNQSITREQLVTMLYNYAKVIGMDTTASAGLDGFPDSEKVSRWAAAPMQWAVAKGFINGREEGNKNYIAPQGTATRAEVAAVLVKFTESLKSK